MFHHHVALSGPARSSEAYATVPIQILGDMQPFGVLLVLDESLTVCQCSASVAEYLGAAPEALLGWGLDEVFSDDLAAATGAAFLRLPSGTLEELGEVRCQGQAHSPLVAWFHAQQGRLFVELIPPGQEPPLCRYPRHGEALTGLLRQATSLLTGGKPVEEFCAVAAESLRRRTGYDRVLVYRFGEQQPGEVVAEARRDDLAPFPYQHDMVFDLPPQAGNRDWHNRVFVLPDVTAEPVPLVPPSARLGTGEEIDLTFCLLRPFSLAQRRSLGDLGVRAALLAPLVTDGRLWGVLACQHLQPLLPGAALRSLVAAVAEMVGVQCQLFDARGARKRADSTEEKAAILALRESEERLQEANRLYHLLADSMEDMISLHDPKGRFLYASPSCRAATGYTAEELLGREFASLVHPDDLPRVKQACQAIVQGEKNIVEFRSVRPDGHFSWQETASSPISDASGLVANIVCCTRDVSQRKALEEQVRQSQKLEAIGQLAGGVAHEFNNLLTVINGYCEMLLVDKPDDDPDRAMLSLILQAGERGAGLTQQLLAFSRKQVLQVEVLDLNAVVLNMKGMLLPLLGEDIHLSTRLAPDLSPVRAAVGQLEQVVMNLAVNARDAMPQGGGLILETANIVLTRTGVHPFPAPRPGRYVQLSVKDTGCGMDAATRDRLFEPFFTTKPPGKGTGLGLATAQRIIRGSEGFITVDSEVGRGTCFHIFLLAVDEQPRVMSVERPGMPRGTETVLVVEDEDLVRTLTSHILEHQGYRVYSAADGLEALALCERLEDPLQLVVTDVVMPGMNGRELVEALVPRYPWLKVLFLSGYTDDAVLRQGLEQEQVAFLQKPYALETLARVVREVLDG